MRIVVVALLVLVKRSASLGLWPGLFEFNMKMYQHIAAFVLFFSY